MRVLHRPDGPHLAVRIAGPQAPGVPVVLVHGMGSDHTTWRRVAASVRSAGRPAVSIDLRGHGRSGRPPGPYRLADFAGDLEFVLDTLALERVDVVGHSLGAHTALRMAMRQPARVRRLVLEEVPPMPRDDKDVAENIAQTASLGERVRGVADVVRNPMPLVRFDRRVGPQVLAEFRLAEPQWWHEVTEVTVPALVISGGAESFLPPRHLRTLADTLPGGRFATIDAGHSVHRDAGTEFLRVVEDFLDES